MKKSFLICIASMALLLSACQLYNGKGKNGGGGKTTTTDTADTGSGSETDTGTVTESGTDTEAGTETTTETGSETQTETETETESETETETETETESETETNTETETTTSTTNTFVYSVSNNPDWLFNDGCLIFTWCWSPNNYPGTWEVPEFENGVFKVSYEGEELTGMLFVRCIAGTTTPNWDETQNVPGRIYNKTDNIDCTAGTYSYSANWH